jgi:hypothetical protein
MHFTKFGRFLGNIMAMKITADTDDFLENCFHIQKGCQFPIRIASFKWGSRELFFIGLEGQKPKGSSGAYDHLHLEKTSFL